MGDLPDECSSEEYDVCGDFRPDGTFRSSDQNVLQQGT